jgi:hypothetical protein
MGYLPFAEDPNIVGERQRTNWLVIADSATNEVKYVIDVGVKEQRGEHGALWDADVGSCVLVVWLRVHLCVR